MVNFDNYTGPTLPDQTVLITPVRCTWVSSTCNCSRLQIPLKLAWAITIHKAQGLTLDKVVVDIGKKEFSSGLTYVACSCMRCLKDLLFTAPFPYERLSNLCKSKHLKKRLQEDLRLQTIEQLSQIPSTSQDTMTASLRATDQGTAPSPPTLDDEHVMIVSPTLHNQGTPSPDWLPDQHAEILLITPLCSLDDQQAVTSSTSHDHDMDTTPPSPVFDDQDIIKPSLDECDAMTPSPLYDDQHIIKPSLDECDATTPSPLYDDQHIIKPLDECDAMTPSPLYDDQHIIKPSLDECDAMTPSPVFDDQDAIKPSPILN